MDHDEAQPLLIQLSPPFQSHFNFFRVTFHCNFSFSKHVTSLNTKFFPRLKALCCIYASSWGLFKEFLSLLYKDFLLPLFLYASSGWFPFLSVTNITKLERLHRAASPAISGCFFPSPIPLVLSEVSLPLLRVIFTHFTLPSYEWSLCLPTSFPISGLARHGVKPRLFRSSWRAFASSHPLMLSSTSPSRGSPCLVFLPSLCSSLFPLYALAVISLSPKVRFSSILISSSFTIWCF